MDKRMLADQLVADFGRMLTLPGLALDKESNSCVLVFDGELLLNIEYDDPAERLVFSIYLDPLPEKGSEALLRELMSANLYWHRTRGATLGLEEATNGIILAYAREVTALDGASFETLVENLLNEAEKWRARIRGEAPADSDTAARPASSSGSGSDFTPIFG